MFSICLYHKNTKKNTSAFPCIFSCSAEVLLLGNYMNSTEFFSVRFHFQDVGVCDYLLRSDQCPICLQQVFLLLFFCPPLNLSFHEQFYIDLFSDFSTFQAYTVAPRTVTVLPAYMII